MKKTYYKNKKYFLSGLFIAIAVFAVVSPKIVNANVISTLAKNSAVALISAPILLSLGTISVLCVAVCGLVNSLIISALINISKYNNFIHEPSIVGAWVVVRDLCNMFFILILLVIAFATILRLPNYEWKKLLPKLLIMAVLINFSRTICGLIIDGSQIIMLTFVNAWANAGEFVDIMGMAKYFHGNMFDKFTEPDWSVLKVVTGMIVGIMFLIISMIVLLVAMSVFLIRVVMLWIYIVLSPIAFLAAAFPAGQKYATQWWTEFMRYIINGPVLAFFIWMALISKNQITKIGDINTANATANQCFGITEATCLNNFLPWIISIGMLLGGLMITQQIGGIGAGIAGKGMGWIKGMASAYAGTVAGTVKKTGSFGKEIGSFGLDWASMKTKGKVDFNLFRTWDRMKDQFAKNKNQRSNDISSQTAEEAMKGGRLAMLTHGGLASQNLNSWQGIKKFFMGAKRNQYGDKAHELSEQREGIMSEDEYNEKLDKKKKQAQNYVDDQSRLAREIDRETNPEEKKKLEEELEETQKQYDNFVANDLAPFRNKQGITVQNNRKVAELDKEIEKNIKLDEEYRVKGGETVNESKRKALADQEKKVDDIDSSARLGQILQSALKKEGNHALIEVIARKMTKQGDYNELCRLMKVGTGTEGMQALAKKFQDKGMSEQSARGLIAEMGGMCAKLGQFGGFGAMKMDKTGRWQEAKKEEAQVAQLSVMKKMPAQTFSRTVGHLGIGFYDDPSGEGKQDKSTYHLSEAAIAHLSSSQKSLGEEYSKNGMAEALEYLSAHTDQLTRNNIDDSKLIGAIKNYKSNIDNATRIKSVKV